MVNQTLFHRYGGFHPHITDHEMYHRISVLVPVLVRVPFLLLWNSRVRVQHDYQKFSTQELRVRVPSTSTPALDMISVSKLVLLCNFIAFKALVVPYVCVPRLHRQSYCIVYWSHRGYLGSDNFYHNLLHWTLCVDPDLVLEQSKMYGVRYNPIRNRRGYLSA